MGAPIEKVKSITSYTAPDTISFRPKKKNREKLYKFLLKEKKDKNYDSVNNTIETILLTHFGIK